MSTQIIEYSTQSLNKKRNTASHIYIDSQSYLHRLYIYNIGVITCNMAAKSDQSATADIETTTTMMTTLLWSKYELSMQAICIDADSRQRFHPNAALLELIGDEKLMWCGSHSLLIFADRCVKIQRNYELLLRQNRELSALYLEERASSDRVRQQLRQCASSRGRHNDGTSAADDEGDECGGIYNTIRNSDGIFRGDDDYEEEDLVARRPRCTSVQSSHRLLQELKELNSSKELMVQAQKRLHSQKEYISGLEHLVSSSNKKIEQLNIHCENMRKSLNKLSSKSEGTEVYNSISTRLASQPPRALDENSSNNINLDSLL